MRRGDFMRVCSLCELKNKEVVNICDGRRLGYIIDAEIDLDCGRVVSLIIPSEGKILSFSKCEPVRVLWCDIEKIGDDVILVRADETLGVRCADKKCER